MADPGFPKGRGANLLFGIICAENCMKMKKIDVVNVVHRLARDVDVAKRRC